MLANNETGLLDLLDHANQILHIDVGVVIKLAKEDGMLLRYYMIYLIAAINRT